MRLSYFFSLTIAAASFCVIGNAYSASIFSDEFVYSAGSSTGFNGGTGFTGAYTGAGSITSPGLTFPGLLTAGNAFTTLSTTAVPNQGAFRTIPNIDTNSGILWVSFLEATNGTVADYAGLSFFSGTTEELFLGKPSSSTNYGFSVSGVTGGALNSAIAPATPAASFLVYRVTFTGAGETIDFFANNTPGVAPTTPTLTFAIPEGSFNTTLNNIRIQSGTQSAPFDEVRAGTTYADVAPVPEPASLGLLAGGALLLATARRARRTAH